MAYNDFTSSAYLPSNLEVVHRTVDVLLCKSIGRFSISDITIEAPRPVWRSTMTMIKAEERLPY